MIVPLPKFHTQLVMVPVAVLVNTAVSGAKPLVSVAVTVPTDGAVAAAARVKVMLPLGLSVK